LNLTDTIKRKAAELGFDLVGITTAAPPPHAAEFRRWLADGFHGEMNYLTRRADDRSDPTRLLPDAKSIIVVGMNYCPSTENRELRTENCYRIARYAQSERDYHDVMGEKLKQLAALVDGIWYVDSSPILERDLAQRAGIGWIGKHTNLINLSLGNWFFLGCVLTTLELPVDAPALEHCGKCTRCITACPTGAIVAPYRLDARRCISYLTIELKGSIPVELRSLIGDRVFGCDDCLEVCPWNRFAKPVITPRKLPALVEFLGWDETKFREFFRGTPIERTKRRGFLRNVCVALGNVGTASDLPALEKAKLDAEPLIREHAAWAVDQICRRAT
jgi:epoxyqueuosine reductase